MAEADLNHLDVITSLQAAGRCVAYYPAFSAVFGCTKCGVFISQMLWWQGKQADPAGWVYKSQTALEEETGLTRAEQETARRKFRDLGILNEERRGNPARLYYLFNWPRFNAMVIERYKKQLAARPRREYREEAPPAKPKPILHGLKDAFDEAHARAFPDDAYNWTAKDFGKLKKLESLFRDRQTRIKALNAKGPVVITDEDVLDGFRHFLLTLPEYWKAQHFSPTSLYSNFSLIVQQIKGTQNGKPKPGVTGGSFADRARSAAKH